VRKSPAVLARLIPRPGVETHALVPWPAIVARAFPGLLTKKLELFIVVFAIAMATATHQTVHLFGQF
jgi:hypothetical protein